ncbi:MAG: 3-hydroxyacyl-CoA dehydrogenase NAD-binding domain-containing protein [Pseudomonadota bacterium]
MPGATLDKDGVLIATIDNPPVNALGASIRAWFSNVLDRVEQDSSIKAMVVTGAGKFFSAGADITEFGKPMAPPYLPDILSRLELCRVPVVAAINGAALGGGLETALACRYRIVSKNASMGLPEVKLGLIPGAGGTQRLPRLTGVKSAAEIITSGNPVDAQKALDIGLVDKLAENDFLEAAILFAQKMAKEEMRPPLSEIEKPDDWDDEWPGAFRKKLEAKARGQLSPLKAFEAVCAAGEYEFADGLKREREIFAECMKSDQRKGLIHSFFAERASKKAPGLEGAAPRDVEVIGILGAGTMGAGIAIACAAGEYAVRLFDTNADALDAGCERIRKTFLRDVEKGRISQAEAQDAIGRIVPVKAMEDFHDADLIIEAVIEEMRVKKAVFSSLDGIAKSGAVLASNTSYLNINDIASVTDRAPDVIGMHFFSPANIMKLLEIVRTDKASPEALATAFSVGKRLGKVSVFAGVCDGFIGNRMFKKYRQQADYLVEDGAMPWEVDRVMRAFGFAMGPFQTSDLAGLDIGWRNRRREDETRDPRERYVAIADRLYEMGRLGQKTGAGWYQYKDGDRTAYVDPQVERLIIEESAAKEINRRSISDDEIKERILFSMINEGAKILEEGIASRALDIDLVFLHGYGFPAYRGGPMFYAGDIGLKTVLERIETFQKEDDFAWVPSSLLKRLVDQGKQAFE